MPASYHAYTGPCSSSRWTQSAASDKSSRARRRARAASRAGRSSTATIRSTGRQLRGPAGSHRQALPILKGRADVYLAGHDHNLQALRPEGNLHFYIAGGGGAGLYDLRPYERSIFASRANGFAVIDGDDQSLTISLVDGTGQVVYAETLKAKGTTPASRD